MTSEIANQNKIRQVRRDSRDDDSLIVVAYKLPSGANSAWTGDDEAPYVKVLGQKLSWYFSPNALEETRTVFTGEGTVFEGLIVNGSATDLFVQFFDNTSPTNGTMFRTAPLGKSGGVFSFNYPNGRRVETGFTFALSSTQVTYTAAAADAATFEIGYQT